MNDDLYREVNEYCERYAQCGADEILRIMGEMRDFFFERMTAEDYAEYERLREAMEQPASAEMRARFGGGGDAQPRSPGN